MSLHNSKLKIMTPCDNLTSARLTDMFSGGWLDCWNVVMHLVWCPKKSISSIKMKSLPIGRKSWTTITPSPLINAKPTPWSSGTALNQQQLQPILVLTLLIKEVASCVRFLAIIKVFKKELWWPSAQSWSNIHHGALYKLHTPISSGEFGCLYWGSTSKSWAQHISHTEKSSGESNTQWVTILLLLSTIRSVGIICIWTTTKRSS